MKKNHLLTKFERDNKLKVNEGILTTTYRYLPTKDQFNLLNFYQPIDDNSKRPLIIYIHGGGWITGDRNNSLKFVYYLVKNGYNVMEMSYRLLSPVQHLIDIVQDVYSSLNYLEDNFKTLDVDTNNIFFAGDSAGGQLSLLIDTINKNISLTNIYKVKPYTFKIKAISLIHPVPFLKHIVVNPDNTLLDIGLSSTLYSLLIPYKKSLIAKYSSIEDYINYAKFPPILITSSYGDTNFYYQTTLLIELFKKKHIYFDTYINKSYELPHVYNLIYGNKKEADKCNEYIINFFNKYLN